MNANLVLFTRNAARKDFPLRSAVTVIGRRPDCDLCIPLISISRRHCELNQDSGILKVRDLGSRNGTFVNGQRIEQAEVKPGDQIGMGPLVFTVQIDGNPQDIPVPGAVIFEGNGKAAKSLDQSGTFAGESQLDRQGRFETEIQPSIDPQADSF